MCFNVSSLIALKDFEIPFGGMEWPWKYASERLESVILNFQQTRVDLCGACAILVV